MNKENAHLYLPLVQALADGKTVQVLNNVRDNPWRDGSEIDFSHKPEDYRIKPLSFPPIPEGMTLHNPDNLTAEQVGDGWRLLVNGEVDGRFRDKSPLWKAEGGVWSPGLSVASCCPEFTYRIPLSTPYPDGSFVKDGQLVKPWSLARHIPGFRPLRDGEEWHGSLEEWVESDLLSGERPVLKGEQYKKGDIRWNGGFGPWEEVEEDGYIEGLQQGHTRFKTRRPLPEPPKRVPLSPSDWLKDGPWWIAPKGNKFQKTMVVEVTGEEIFYREGFMTHERAMEYMRSNDGITWSLCSKPA